MTMRRVDYHWHLRRIMAAHNMWKTTDLAPLLRERGINLRSSDLALVAEKPERQKGLRRGHGNQPWRTPGRSRVVPAPAGAGH